MGLAKSLTVNNLQDCGIVWYGFGWILKSVKSLPVNNLAPKSPYIGCLTVLDTPPPACYLKGAHREQVTHHTGGTTMSRAEYKLIKGVGIAAVLVWVAVFVGMALVA